MHCTTTSPRSSPLARRCTWVDDRAVGVFLEQVLELASQVVELAAGDEDSVLVEVFKEDRVACLLVQLDDELFDGRVAVQEVVSVDPLCVRGECRERETYHSMSTPA